MAIPNMPPIVLAKTSHTSNMPRRVTYCIASAVTDKTAGNQQYHFFNGRPSGMNRSTLSRHPDGLNPKNSMRAAPAGLSITLGILLSNVVYRTSTRPYINNALRRYEEDLFRVNAKPTIKILIMIVTSTGVVLFKMSFIQISHSF